MIRQIVVAGAGTMGSSMAQIFAENGYLVTLYDLSEQALDTAKVRIMGSVNTLLEEKELNEHQAEALFAHLSYSNEKDCFKTCDLVVENIVEKEAVKRSFYQEISELVSPQTLLATNTSGLSINVLASAVQHPQRFIGMHWFNPPHLIPLIEIIKGDQTSEDTASQIYELSLANHKKPVIVEKDVLGFAANRLQFALLREALALVEDGVVSMEGIDDGMTYGLGFRYACLGPLAIADFGGLDTFYHISEYLMRDLCDSHEVPTLLQKAYEENRLGVKNGHGFYDYSGEKAVLAIKERDDKYLALHALFYKNK